MMFRTEVHPRPAGKQIGPGDKLLFLGSCFAGHIGDLLAGYKWVVQVNPFGTLFNPLSIEKALQMAAESSELEEWGFTEQQGVFYHHDLHSDISALSADDLTGRFRQQREGMKSFLRNSRVLVLTLGTALVHCHTTAGKAVANCHKAPASRFTSRILEEQEVAEALLRIRDLYQKLAPEGWILLTLSPVRHLRSGLEDNAVSKSVLRLAIEKIRRLHDDMVYFPAYEILLDDLRDYRFYDQDLVHPSRAAIDYIWEKFTGSCMDAAAQDFISRWTPIRQALQHRPFHPGSPAHQAFLRKTILELEGFKDIVDVAGELRHFRSQLI
jgi:hypothetical protein